LKKKKIDIDVLINNAGIGTYGDFVEADWKKEHTMIELNVTTLTLFSKLFAREMVKRKSGKILNVASTAAFQPGPLMAVYFATKAYVLSFSQALAYELKDKGISVTALCPGPTVSGFETAAKMGESGLFKGKNLPTSREVALYGYNSMMAGKKIAVHGFRNRLGIFFSRFVPESFKVKVVASMNRG